MIYKAYLSDTKKFLSLPETGMGYQIFEAKKFGEPYKDKFVVYNAQLVIDLDDKFIEFKRQAFTKGFSNILNESEGLPVNTDTISLLPKNLILESRFLSESKKSNKKRHSGEKGAKDNPKESADGKEIFVRLSAYEDDKRIDLVNNRLKEGAYTTILSDYFDCVNTQDDPVDRYALPNDEIIK